MDSGSIVVYGGSGALGRAIVTDFISKKWTVFSIDFIPNQEATSILLEKNDTLEEQNKRVIGAISCKVDAIVCVAGGWAGGNAASDGKKTIVDVQSIRPIIYSSSLLIVKMTNICARGYLFASSEMMWKQSVHSSLIASHLATKSLKPGGLLLLTGAYPAQRGTPFMIGYGMAKAAVHQLVLSLAEHDSGLPDDVKVNAILPVTLDTPMNRSGMPNADFSTWTPLSEVAETIFKWASKKEPAPTGKLIEIMTKGGKTTYTPK
ncbi:hypothetical protein BGZ65_003429 [Modicella reniformis]|uniref:Dihydropteridine reductase n=1 Tax=Modicella reniformis TaxID=1440133 RepID=A0A9P6LZL7_9FUNG|nr:hypothetical protein BGZ65_003429 [Modicella reniformis]